MRHTFHQNAILANRPETSCPSARTFGQRLRARRNGLGLLAKELGPMCRMSHSIIQALEQGQRSPLLHEIKALADQLGTTPGHLVSDELDRAEAEIERLRELLESRP